MPVYLHWSSWFTDPGKMTMGEILTNTFFQLTFHNNENGSNKDLARRWVRKIKSVNNKPPKLLRICTVSGPKCQESASGRKRKFEYSGTRIVNQNLFQRKCHFQQSDAPILARLLAEVNFTSCTCLAWVWSD